MPAPTAVTVNNNGLDPKDLQPEKDDTERKLETLLFGDEAGFLDSLRHSQILDTDASHNGEEEDLDDVADEDVRSNQTLIY